MVNYPKSKISNKKRPTLFLRGDNRIAQLKASHINEKSAKFETSFLRETGLRPINSVRDLADNLKRYNKSLNDTTIVYCKGADQDDMSKESTKAAIRLMRQESKNPLLIASGEEITKQLRMEPGKFYAYYKPSFINGFEQYMEKDINFDYLQAYEGVCRDEFTVKPTYIDSDEFKTLLSSTRGIQTEKFAQEIFDQCFSRTFNVEFAFNPNFKEFRRKFKNADGKASKPIIFVYSPPLYMSRYIGEFKQVLQNYTEAFDIYYTGDQEKASQLFYTKEFPEIFPYVVIIDPKKRKGLKSAQSMIT